MKPTRYTKQRHRSCGRETNIRHYWVNGEKIAHTVARCIQFVNAVPGLAVKLVGSHAKVRDIVATDIDLSFQVRGPREEATATVQCGAVQCAIVEECCNVVALCSWGPTRSVWLSARALLATSAPMTRMCLIGTLKCFAKPKRSW